MKKKLLSILLATFMVLTLVPVTIFAEKTPLETLAITANYDKVDITDKSTFVTAISSNPNLESAGKHEIYLCNGEDCLYEYKYETGKWYDDNSSEIELNDIVLDNIDNMYYRIDYVMNNTDYSVTDISSTTITVDGNEIGEYEEGCVDYKYTDDGTHLFVYHTIYKSGDDKSGSTTITATVEHEPEPELELEYGIVIPSNVEMTEAGIKAIGAPSVENVNYATANTVISYTATADEYFVNSEDDKLTMAASYYKDDKGETPLTTDPITVYENKAIVDPLTTLYVGIIEDVWNAADPGTYTATVTFNFEAKDKLPDSITLAQLIATNPAFPTTYQYGWWGDGNLWSENGNLNYQTGEDAPVTVSLTTTATLDKSTNTYKFTWAALDNATVEFILDNNVLTTIKINGDPYIPQ